jgi:hypothetical protein
MIALGVTVFAGLIGGSPGAAHNIGASSFWNTRKARAVLRSASLAGAPVCRCFKVTCELVGVTGFAAIGAESLNKQTFPGGLLPTGYLNSGNKHNKSRTQPNSPLRTSDYLSHDAEIWIDELLVKSLHALMFTISANWHLRQREFLFLGLSESEAVGRGEILTNSNTAQPGCPIGAHHASSRGEESR